MLDIASPLLAHLSTGVDLAASDRALIGKAFGGTVRSISDRSNIATEGDMSRGVTVLLSGWAFRCRSLPDGRRQLLSLLLPGDVCVMPSSMHRKMDHSIRALTPVRYAELDHRAFDTLIARAPGIAEAFRWAEMVAWSIQSEWTMSIGQRSGLARVAHLLCETTVRLGARGLGGPTRWTFPLTQMDIAEATGLTAVHVNRMLQQLRHEELIKLQSKSLTIASPRRLAEAALFRPDYLHLDHAKAPADEVTPGA